VAAPRACRSSQHCAPGEHEGEVASSPSPLGIEDHYSKRSLEENPSRRSRNFRTYPPSAPNGQGLSCRPPAMLPSRDRAAARPCRRQTRAADRPPDSAMQEPAGGQLLPFVRRTPARLHPRRNHADMIPMSDVVHTSNSANTTLPLQDVAPSKPARLDARTSDLASKPARLHGEAFTELLLAPTCLPPPFPAKARAGARSGPTLKQDGTPQSWNPRQRALWTRFTLE
jgi:hypothetical protein